MAPKPELARLAYVCGLVLAVTIISIVERLLRGLRPWSAGIGQQVSILPADGSLVTARPGL